MQFKTDGINPADKATGVVGYTARVYRCPVTGKPTNLVFRNRDTGKLVVAIDQDAANIVTNPQWKPL